MIFKERTCKYCKAKYLPTKAKQIVCGAECAIGWNDKQKSRALSSQQRMARKELREKKVALKTRSDWIKEVQIVFNKFIRCRDMGLDCISCGALLGAELVGGGFDAGHYLSRGAKPHLRFDERNVHGQCKRCNRYLSGNVSNYRERLIRRIGIVSVMALEADNTPKHYTIDDLKALKAHYQAKVKQLESR